MPDTTTALTTNEQKQLATQVDNLLASRSYFIEKVLPILHDKQDYYEIKGKKSLAKGGAEKLASIFNLVAAFTVDKDTMELLPVTGMVAYICDLKDRDGHERGQGRGADMLSRNQNDPNKTIKMAQKRAYIDAIIRATGLSDIFTQDVEDMGEVVYAPISPTTPVEPRKYSQPPIAPPNASQAVKKPVAEASKTFPQTDKIKNLATILDPSISNGAELAKYVLDKTGFDLAKVTYHEMIITRLENMLEKKKEADDEVLLSEIPF